MVSPQPPKTLWYKVKQEGMSRLEKKRIEKTKKRENKKKKTNKMRRDLQKRKTHSKLFSSSRRVRDYNRAVTNIKRREGKIPKQR